MNRYIVADIHSNFVTFLLFEKRKEYEIASVYYDKLASKYGQLIDDLSIDICVYNLKYRLDKFLSKLLIYFDPLDESKDYNLERCFPVLMEMNIGVKGSIFEHTKLSFTEHFGSVSDTVCEKIYANPNNVLGLFILKDIYSNNDGTLHGLHGIIGFSDYGLYIDFD